MIKRGNLLKLILTGTAAICAVPESQAIESKVKLGGVLEFQSIFNKNNGASNQRIVSKNNKSFGFNTSGNMFVDYQLVSDNNIKYGSKIALELTSANDRGVPFSIYAESNLGKIEAGSDRSAGQKMKITGYAASCAVGNGWNSRIKSSPYPNLVGYATSFCSFLDAKMRSPYKVEYSRKITYFTPKMNLNESNNIQLGISYIPDSSNMGYDTIQHDAKHTPVSASKYNFVIKNGLSYGITHIGEFSEIASIRTSFVGERGQPIGFKKTTKEKSDIKFKDLNTYVLGTEIKYDKCAVSGSYGNYNRSLTSQEVDLRGKETYIYAIGGKYNFDKYATSLSYFGSNHKNNKFNATTLGLDYNIAQGLKSYVQITYYEAHGKYLKKSTLKSDNSKGTLVVAGAKVNL